MTDGLCVAKTGAPRQDCSCLTESESCGHALARPEASGFQLPFGSLAARLARLGLGFGAPSQAASPLAWLRVTVQAREFKLPATPAGGPVCDCLLFVCVCMCRYVQVCVGICAKSRQKCLKCEMHASRASFLVLHGPGWTVRARSALVVPVPSPITANLGG